MKSMTGFGRGTCLKDGREITIEMRSVNHKFLDLSFRMPRTLSFLEDSLRTWTAKCLIRGHIDITVAYRNTRDDAKQVSIDNAIVEQYITAGTALTEKYELRNDLSVMGLMRMPEVITVTEKEEDMDAIRDIALCAATQALDTLTAMREREGECLKSDLGKKLDALEVIREEIESRSCSSMMEHKKKLEERVAALMPKGVEVDAARLATEIALMADKASVDEELVRIKTHIDNMRIMLESTDAIGRKLDFLLQELNREFNTTGSKSTDTTIAQCVISGKAEIEKMREQIQNIE